MAEKLLSFGVEKLWDLLARESERLQGVEDQLNELKSDLEMLRCFLKDSYAKKHTSEMVKNILNDTKEIVYDAEDIVEKFLLTEELGKTNGIRNYVRRYSSIFMRRRRLALDMEAISKRISKVVRKMEILGVQQIASNQGYTESLQERQREARQTFSNDNESILVGLGFDKNVTKLVDYLVKEDSPSQVVSITGMGGIGKTTLARKIFHHEIVRSHFAAGQAWVCVSQQFTRKDVWQTILRKLKPDYKVSEMKEDELQEKISQVLETQKALIVLDDVWEKEHWDIINPIFQRGKGWKVLLTSRHEYVGLRVGSHIVGEFSDSMYHVLYLSFEELPSYLKHCFLYLAHFPEDYEINVEKLSYCWAAEGITRPRCYDDLTVREVGDGYIEELVKRNMVISERDVHTSRFETCQLHDMMREICLFKAEEENFLQVVDGKSTASNSKSRRLAVHRHEGINDSVNEIKNPKIRSLLFINLQFHWMGSNLCFTRLQLMRILDLSGAKFMERKLPSSIGELIHLRYLSLYNALVTHLPSSLRNLKLLLCLNLEVRPHSLDELRDVENLTILQRLRTLSIVFYKDLTVEALSELKDLENLTITLDEFCQLEEDPMPILEKLLHLKELTFYPQSFCGRRMVCSAGGFPQLQYLEFRGLYGWEELILEEGSMPFLHTLTIRSCWKLKELPEGLRI